MNTGKFTQILAALMIGLFSATSFHSKAQAITEGFDNITSLTSSGWSLQNLSAPLGSSGWFQGNPATFTSQNGATNSYIAADVNNTSAVYPTTGTISNWLITPNRTFKNGDVVTFYTRSAGSLTRQDRLQVRMSTNGASTNVGTTATSVGDFTNQLLEINAGQTALVYPTTFTQYTLTISGLTAPTSGRIAFRYFVTGAASGLLGDGNYIGIDNFVYTPLVCPAFTVNPATIPNPILGSAYTQSFTTANGSGTPVYTVSSGALPAGLTLSPAGILSGTATAAGTSNFTITSTDATTACSGSRAYTVVIACPTITVNPATLPNGTAGTGYSQTITQTGAVGTTTYTLSSGSLPTGLTLSGTGAITGTPTASGTYSFTILASASSGCTGSRAYSVVIGCPAGNVTLSPFTAVCSNAPAITLTGGSPAGGTYSGTGVTAGSFNPAAGTQTITYSYINSFGCTNTVSQVFTVNAAPVISFSPIPSLCSDALPFTLSNATPTGGMFSGSSLMNGLFFPSAGTQTIKYIVTNSAGCTDSANQTITVRTAPTVTQDTSFSRLCAGSTPVTLTGGTPAGGVYSGVNVDTGRFNPSTIGTYVIGYTATGTNGCRASAVKTITVVDCSTQSTTGVATTTSIGSKAGRMECFPNPVNTVLHIRFYQDKAGDVSLRVMNLEGRVVLHQPAVKTSGNFETSIDMSTLPKGCYFIMVNGASQQAVQKVLLD